MVVVLPWEHRVCKECWKQNPHSLWLVKYKCLGRHSQPTFVPVVIDKENTALVIVRPPPSTMMDFRGRFHMCENAYRDCRNGANCVYAHTSLELDKWNATKSILEFPSHLRGYTVYAQSPSQVCSDCYTNNPYAVWLTWLTCSKRDHNSKTTVVISNDQNRLVKVRDPSKSVRQMTLDQINRLLFHSDCGRDCSTPHSQEERDYWLWKVVRGKMAQTMHMYGNLGFWEMCQKYSYPENHEQLLESAKKLSHDNYRGKYHRLVYLDNLAHAQKMIDDCDGLLEVSKSREYQVHITGMQNTAMDYVQQNTPPCTVLIRVADKVFTGKFVYKSRQSLVVELDHYRSMPGLPCEAFVHFEYNHWYFWRLHRAIEHASSALIQRLVEPSEARYLPTPQRKAANRKLRAINIDTEYQSRALRKMLLCRPGSPFLLMGPFGTGKTHLLVTSITKLVLAGGNTILVCAHQNKGADHICRSLLDLKILDCGVITRLYPDAKTGDLPPAVCLAIRAVNVISIIAKKKVIITTFMTALKLKEFDRNNQLQFTQIIIDEGAQSREPEALGALLMANEHTHIIIAGDNKQVGPAVSVFSDLARDSGLGESLLERLLTLYKTRYDKRQLNFHRHSLLTNYRCHPSILMLASSLFYECTLLSRSNSQAHPKAPYPLVFQCSSLQQHMKAPSTVNYQEAELLISKALEFIDAWPGTGDPKCPKPRIAILAGSAGQVSALRTCKQQVARDIQNVDIDITHTYTIQGSEFDAVFLSTHEPTDKEGKPLNMVRSICNEYVFNTVITRSRSLVFAVGNPFRLVQMGTHFSTECWKEFIQRTITCQSFYLPQSNDTLKQDLPSLTSELTESVLPCELFKDLEEPDDSSYCDDIITNYIKLLDMRPERYRGIKLVQDPKKDVKAWQLDTVPENKGIVLAELDLRNHRKGTVKPHNAPQIRVSSMRDRRCLFPGDEVPIDAKTNEIVMNEKYEHKFNETHFGKSIVCRVNPRSMIEFMPLDKRYPKLVIAHQIR